MSKKVTVLDGIVYNSRSELENAIRTYMNNAELNKMLWDNLPYAILERHPDYTEKVGCGVRYIEVRLSEYKNNRCFYIVRTDRSEIDFSWRVAMRFAPSEPSLAAAAREAVWNQISYVAAQDPSKIVHHIVPFRQLLNEWMATRNWKMPELMSYGQHDYFASHEDKKSWQDYHQSNAELQLVTLEEHKQLHSRRDK